MYSPQIGNARSGLMGTLMPQSYAPHFQMPMQGFDHPMQGANDYMSNAYSMSGSNIGQDASGPSGFKDRGMMSGQGSPY